MAGLCALGQLEFDHFDLGQLGFGLKEIRREAALVGAATEVPRAHLPDHVPSGLAMMNAQAPFSGIVGEATLERPHVQGAHGVGTQRAEAHSRDVQKGSRIGLLAIRSPDLHTKVSAGVLDRGTRPGGMADEPVPVAIDVEFRPEGFHCLDALGSPVHQVPGVAVEGPPAGVAFHEVLMDFRSGALEKKS